MLMLNSSTGVDRVDISTRPVTETFRLFQAKIYAKYFQDYTFLFNMKTAPPVSCACRLVAIGIM
jgi:hypothetical protein